MPDEIILTINVPNNVNPEFEAKTAKEVQHSLEVKKSLEQTYIIVIAYNRERGRNFVNKISCKKGLPIGGYTYDSQSDSYHIECTDYLHLGYIPISFVAGMKGVKDWEVRVPMPETVIKKHLSSLQKKELKNFKNHFKSETYEIQFVQMIDPN